MPVHLITDSAGFRPLHNANDDCLTRFLALLNMFTAGYGLKDADQMASDVLAR